MRRRDFIGLLGGAAVVWPLSADAQQPGKIYRIGILSATEPTGLFDRKAVLREAMHKLGHLEGRDFVIELRSANGRFERLPALADELVRSVDVIVAGGSSAIRAAQKATPTIPIIMSGDGRPCCKWARPKLGTARW